MDWFAFDPEFLKQLREWIAPGAVALVCFFLVRYITKRDKFETDLEKKFEAHAEKFNQRLQTHAGEVATASTQFRNAVLEVKAEAAEMRKANADFQMAVNEKLLSLDKTALTIKATLDSTVEKATELEAKVDQTKQKVEEMADMVSSHEINIGDLAKRYLEHNRRIKKAEMEVVRLKARKPSKH